MSNSTYAVVATRMAPGGELAALAVVNLNDALDVTATWSTTLSAAAPHQAGNRGQSSDEPIFAGPNSTDAASAGPSYTNSAAADPTFAAVADTLIARLGGQTVVTHDVARQLRPVRDAFAAVGVDAAALTELAADTQLLVADYLGAPTEDLEQALQRARISHPLPGTVLGDALATAALLRLVVVSPEVDAPEPRVDLTDLIYELPPSPSGDMGAYRTRLLGTLLHGDLNEDDFFVLEDIAHELQLSLEDTRDIHSDVVRQLATQALMTGPLDEARRAELVRLGTRLGVQVRDVDTLLREPAHRSLPALDASPGADPAAARPERRGIAFLGPLTLSREEWWQRVTAAQLLPQGAVDEHTAVIVAPRPYGEHRRYAEARRFGVPVFTEQEFARALGRSAREHGYSLGADVTVPAVDAAAAQRFPWTVAEGVSPEDPSAVAAAWVARHAHEPLFQLSPVLREEDALEHAPGGLHALLRRWEEAFPAPLRASAAELRGLHGVGRKRQFDIVYAVVLAALDVAVDGQPLGSDNRAASEDVPDLYLGDEAATQPAAVPSASMAHAARVGWWLLSGALRDTALPPGLVPDGASEDRGDQSLAHAALLALLHTAEEQLVQLASGDPLKLSLIADGAIASQSGGGPATPTGAEGSYAPAADTTASRAQLERDIADLYPRGVLAVAVADGLGRWATPVAHIDDLVARFPALTAGTQSLSLDYLTWLSRLATTWERQGEWIVPAGETRPLLRASAQLADTWGLIALDQLSDATHLPPERLRSYLRETGETLYANQWVTRIDAAVALRLAGRPLTPEGIRDFVRTDLASSLDLQALAVDEDPRVHQVSATEWALRDWGGEDYREDLWEARARVTPDALRGGPLQARGPLPEIPDIEWQGRIALGGPLGEVTVWGDTADTLTVIGARPYLAEADIPAGAEVWLRFDGQAGFRVRRA